MTDRRFIELEYHKWMYDPCGVEGFILTITGLQSCDPFGIIYYSMVCDHLVSCRLLVLHTCWLQGPFGRQRQDEVQAGQPIACGDNRHLAGAFRSARLRGEASPPVEGISDTHVIM